MGIPLHNWTPEFILSEIRRLHAEHGKINVTFMHKNFPALYRNSRKFFGSYKNAVLEAGIDPSVAGLNRGREDLLNSIRDLAAKGAPLNYLHVRTNNISLYCSAAHYYGGWYPAIEAAGLNPDNYRLDGTDAVLGYQFEDVMKDVLRVCNGYQLYNTPLDRDGVVCVPDFVIDEKTWLDVKLSSWTAFTNRCDTIEKYTPHCDKLIIVYLRGNDIKHSYPKVEMRDVAFYFPQLHEAGRSDIVDRLLQLRSQAYESIDAA